VALDCGFFDQAHFNHEVRDLAGMSPGDLSTFPNVSF
jgi:AraC-like DNA-binding protein